MNKQQLAQKIWTSANQMRSKIGANEYKDFILGFIFYKYLSNKEVLFLKENSCSEEDLENISEEEDNGTVKWVQNNIGYFISYENLFSTWLDMGKDFNVSNVRDALSAFSRLVSDTHKRVFGNVFDTLQTGLSKLGDNSGSQTKAVSDLISLIKDIPMDGKQDYDVLGFIYEYLIGMFAANAGKKAGEFYTPHEVSLLMSEIVANHLKDRDKIEIYDPTSGSGSLLINIGKSASKYIEGDNKIKYYAQELNTDSYNLTRMNLVMRGISASNIMTRNADTLADDWPYFDESDPSGTYNPLYVDAVVSNPPYSQSWNPDNKESDPRYSGFGLAPKGKADYAFLLHDLYHIKPDGIMTIVLPHGVLFRGGEEGEIRKNLVEKNKIDAIIGLPSNIFFGTGIPTIIMVLKQKKENDDILIIDASKGFIKDGKNNKLRASDIKRISDVVIKRENIDKFSRVVSREEIRRNEYNLNIPRYVNSSEPDESWDLYSLMFGGIPLSEIDILDKYWKAFPSLKTSLFEKTNSLGYYRFVSDNVKNIIKEHSDIKSFEEIFRNAFIGFDKYLYDELISKMDSVSISKEEEIITSDVFNRLVNVPLVDKYEAYQLFDDVWSKIAIDLEMIQTEGFETIKAVEPNLVIKKKDNKDEEVQDGWRGHIIPFELVQNTFLSEDKQLLKEKENRLSEIASEYEEELNSLTDEEKEGEFIDDDKWVFAEVKKAIKSGNITSEMKDKLKTVDSLNTEEKSLKSAIKAGNSELEKKSKEIIENLSDEQALDILKKKWIDPLISNLMQIPDRIIADFASQLELLSKKYETTFAEVESQIKEVETNLIEMIDDLDGSESDLLGLEELKKLLGEV